MCDVASLHVRPAEQVLAICYTCVACTAAGAAARRKWFWCMPARVVGTEQAMLVVRLAARRYQLCSYAACAITLYRRCAHTRIRALVAPRRRGGLMATTRRHRDKWAVERSLACVAPKPRLTDGKRACLGCARLRLPMQHAHATCARDMPMQHAHAPTSSAATGICIPPGGVCMLSAGPCACAAGSGIRRPGRQGLRHRVMHVHAASEERCAWSTQHGGAIGRSRHHSPRLDSRTPQGSSQSAVQVDACAAGRGIRSPGW
jgi:hypothetical protein